MNFKRFSSFFLLLLILIGNFSLPISAGAVDDCKVVNAQFTKKPNGANWYNSDSTTHLLVAINSADSCKDKKINVKVIAKSSESGEDSIDATKTPLEALFEPGVTSMTIPLTVKEEKCFDLDSWNITNDFDGADDLTDVLHKSGKDETEFYTNVYNQLKTGKIGDDLATLSYFPGALNKLDYLVIDLIPDTWIREKLFSPTDRSELVNTKESVQKILNRIQAVELPADKAYLGSLVGKWDFGIINNINDAKQSTFRDAIAKTIFFKAGIRDCEYKIQTAVDSGEFTDTLGGDFSFMCDIGWTSVGDDCGDGVWAATTGFSPGIRPTVITDSLCLNEDGSTYDEDCYETLAPIPGFGRKLNFSEDGGKGTPFTLGTYIGTVVKITIGAASVAAVIFLTYAGIMYMIAGKSGGGALLDQARKRLINVAWGLAVILGSWILLNTINPELLKINPKIDRVTLEAPTMLISKADFKKITGQEVLDPGVYKAQGRTIGAALGIPPCVSDVILTRESKGNPGVVGLDANAAKQGVASRVAFIGSGKKYGGSTFTPNSGEALVTNGKFRNDDGISMKGGRTIDVNSPTLGLDWRFSIGWGLSQTTTFPEKYFEGKNKKNMNIYYDWVRATDPKSAPMHIRDNLGKPIAGFKEMLDPKISLEKGLNTWKKAYDSCGKDIKKAFFAYGSGDCDKDPLGGEGSLRYSLYEKCVAGGEI